MSLSNDDKAKMGEAKKLIKQKKFFEAYEIIEYLDNPVAEQWRNKLQDIMQGDAKDDLKTDTISSGQSVSIETKPQKRRTVRILGAIILSLVIVLAGLMIYDNIQIQRRLEVKKVEAYPILYDFCKFNTNLQDNQCDRWVNNTLNNDSANIFIVISCASFGNTDPNSLFYACIQSSDIYLP